MVKVDVGSMSSQSSSVSSIVNARVTGLNSAVTALNALLNEDSLQGTAYTSAKGYASNVLIPLIQAMILYSESVSENTAQLNHQYASIVGGESLDSEILEQQIQSLENSYLSARYSHELLLQDMSPSATNFVALMDSIQGKLATQREKLRKLNHFNSVSAHTFSDIGSLEVALMSGLNQVSANFSGFSASQGFPSYNKSNLSWAKAVSSQWKEREDVISDFERVSSKVKKQETLTAEDLVVIEEYKKRFPDRKIDQEILSESQKKKNNFSINTEQDREFIGNKLFSEGKLWVDEKGQLYADGSAEAAAFLLNLETNTGFEIAGVKFNSKGEAIVGAKAASNIKSNLTAKGFEVKADGEFLAGVKMAQENGFEVGEGILSLKGSQKSEALLGAWAKADAEFKANKYGAKLSGDIEAKAGAEINAESSITGFDDHAKISVQGDAFAGAKAGANAEISAGVDGVSLSAGAEAFAGAEANADTSIKIGATTVKVGTGVKKGFGADANVDLQIGGGNIFAELDLGAALGLGAGVEASIDFDYQEALQDIEDFSTWIITIGEKK